MLFVFPMEEIISFAQLVLMRKVAFKKFKKEFQMKFSVLLWSNEMAALDSGTMTDLSFGLALS